MKISSILLLVFLIFAGCSSNKSNPVIPVDKDNGLDLPLVQMDNSATGHQILGAFSRCQTPTFH